MVRRSAATNLGKFASIVEAAYLKTDIISIFDDLTHDGAFNITLGICYKKANMRIDLPV